MNIFLSTVVTILSKTLSAIGKAFRWVFSDARRVIILLLGVAVVGLALNYHSLKHDYDNLVVDSRDSVMTYKNKANQLYAMNQGYITDIKTLQDQNSALYKEVKNLKDNPIVVTKTEIEYRIDSIKVYTDTTYAKNDSSIYVSNFSYNDGWCKIAGYNTFNVADHTSETFLNTIGAQSSLYVDLIEKDKKLQFIARADNPYIQINSIEGAMLSPEKSKVLKKRFNKPWGVMIGVGPSVVVTNNKVQVYPALQLTVGYKFISF